MSTYLGIDYGRAQVGVALAEASLSHPLATLRAGPTLLPALIKHIQLHRVDQLVIGLPDGPLAQEVKAFATELHARTGLPVVLHPETLSTKSAISALRFVGGSRQKLHRKIKNNHVYAACLILDDYLDMLNSSLGG